MDSNPSRVFSLRLRQRNGTSKPRNTSRCEKRTASSDKDDLEYVLTGKNTGYRHLAGPAKFPPDIDALNDRGKPHRFATGGFDAYLETRTLVDRSPRGPENEGSNGSNSQDP